MKTILLCTLLVIFAICFATHKSTFVQLPGFPSASYTCTCVRAVPGSSLGLPRMEIQRWIEKQQKTNARKCNLHKFRGQAISMANQYCLWLLKKLPTFKMSCKFVNAYNFPTNFQCHLKVCICYHNFPTLQGPKKYLLNGVCGISQQSRWLRSKFHQNVSLFSAHISFF